MDVLNKESLEKLIETDADPCVSIYLPTHRSLPEAKQDPIRFKNLLRDAERSLEARETNASQGRDLLKPAAALLDDPQFWRYQGDGLAVFLSAEELRTFRLPISFKELAVVSDHFHLKPLLPMLSSDDRFFILALSKNEVRLIEATRYGASEIQLENVPDSLAEILGTYDFEGQLQFHTGAQPTGGERAGMFHGHGGGVDDVKPRVIEYFRQIDRGLRERLHNETAPLVIAGVESLFPIYREVNTYAALMADGIAGNPESISPEELRQRGWQIVEPQSLKARTEAAERYHALAGTGRSSNDLSETVLAAHDGRVEELFVAVGVQVWGTLDEETRFVEIHEQRGQNDRDLLDICAIKTLTKGGSVHVVEPDAVPGGRFVAATFRY